MSDSATEIFQALDKVLLRCWILGFALLLITMVAYLFWRETIYRRHATMFELAPSDFHLIVYCFMGFTKLGVLLLFLIPWLSIRLVLKS